jgi:hypothetical protein
MRGSGAGRRLLYLKRWCWILTYPSIDIAGARQVRVENTDSVANSVSLRLSGFTDCEEAADFAVNLLPLPLQAFTRR